MQAIKSFCTQHIQVDLLVNHFCLLIIGLLVNIENFVLAKLVVKFNKLFQRLTITDGVCQSLDNCSGVIRTAWLDLVESLLKYA